MTLVTQVAVPDVAWFFEHDPQAYALADGMVAVKIQGGAAWAVYPAVTVGLPSIANDVATSLRRLNESAWCGVLVPMGKVLAWAMRHPPGEQGCSVGTSIAVFERGLIRDAIQVLVQFSKDNHIESPRGDIVAHGGGFAFLLQTRNPDILVAVMSMESDIVAGDDPLVLP